MPASPHRLLALVAWAVACGPPPCLPADAVEISVAPGARPGLLPELKAGLARYRRWTGGPAPCLREIRLESELWVAGLPAEGQLLIEPRVLRIGPRARDGSQALLHELCHLWDADAGWPSEQDALGARLPALPENPAYPGSLDRRHESFARLCALGPVDPALAGARPDCGDADPALLAEIGARVWPAAAPPLRPLDVGRVVEADDLPLGPLLGGASLLRAAPCGDRLCALVLGADSALLTEGSFPQGWDRLAMALLVLDPQGPRLERAIPVPRRDEAGWSLLGGPEGLLVVEAGVQTRGFWVGAEGGAPAPMDVPALPPGATVNGVVAGGAAYVEGPWAPWVKAGEIGRLDLAQGSIAVVDDLRLPTWGPGGLLRSVPLEAGDPALSRRLSLAEATFILSPGRATGTAHLLENGELALQVPGAGWIRRSPAGAWLRADQPCQATQTEAPLSIGSELWLIQGGARQPSLRRLSLPG